MDGLVEMPTYLIDFDEMLKKTRSIDGWKTDKHAFYWEGDDEYVVEYPVVNVDGSSTGVVFRSEIPYEALAEEILEHNPAAQESEIDNVVVMFEKVFLAGWFKKVEGEHVTRVAPLIVYSARV